jgi:hypothetical protein
MLTVATRNMVDAQWSKPDDLARGTSAFAPLAFEVAANRRVVPLRDIGASVLMLPEGLGRKTVPTLR